MLPTFSIIVPTHARPERLRSCLASLADLDYDRDHFEIIVVDDGTNPPRPIAEAVDTVRDRVEVTLIPQARGGPAAARNRGGRSASNEVLAFTDDDCRPEPRWLRALAAAWDDEDDHVVGGHTLNALDRNPYSAATQAMTDYLRERGQASGAPFFASSNLALSRGLFERIGGFSEAFRLAAGEDRDFSDRCVLAGCHMVYAPDAVVLHEHALDLIRFLRQHFQYGRGAFAFHEARRRRRERGGRFEPLGFYARLVTHPLRRTSRTGAAVHIALLLGVAQLANAAGYVYESRRSARS